MKRQDLLDRVRQELRAELKKAKRHTLIKDIEAALGRDQGYLRTLWSGRTQMTLDQLFEILDTIGVHPGLFLANALDAPRGSDHVLAELRPGGKGVHKRFYELERATLASEARLAEDTSAPPHEDPALAAELLELITAAHPREQIRRLRSTALYRHAGFVRLYLEYLDSLRYHEPTYVTYSARSVAVNLLPNMPCDAFERLRLQLLNLGIYASAHRMTYGFATAHRALCLALALARKHRMRRLTGELLQRGAYLLCDHARYGEAMSLLDEAIVIYLHFGEQGDLGRTIVDRANVHHYRGEYDEGIETAEKALSMISGDSNSLRRNQRSAYSIIAQCHQSIGRIRRAEAALAKAADIPGSPGDLDNAKILWQLGTVASKKGFLRHAEHHLRGAREIFAKKRSTDKALVSLDLTETLLALGKTDEAVAMACGMAEFLTHFQSNEVLCAALARFVRNALEGRLTAQRIHEIRAQIGANSRERRERRI